MTLLEYIWTDANGVPRSKNRIVTHLVDQDDLSTVPEWNFDGSSTGQAKTGDSEVLLKPVVLYFDPFTDDSHYESWLVLCETYDSKTNQPLPSNKRAAVREALENGADAWDAWFGMEQEFFLMDANTGLALTTKLRPQGDFYCGTGAKNALGRSIVQHAYEAGLHAGVKICGMNAEVAPGQWEIQVGPLSPLSIADDVVMLRYILHRCSEGTEMAVVFGAKPLPGYNGSGMHTNFSTNVMRKPKTGKQAIRDAIQFLGERHAEHLAAYAGRNNDNAQRLTGTHETSDPKVFSSGVGARDASIRIPTHVDKQGYGYIEDRRPSSSCDPYTIVLALLQTCCT